MPQMSPLMWGLMFIIFSALLFMGFVKTYFNYLGETKSSQEALVNQAVKSTLTWLW